MEWARDVVLAVDVQALSMLRASQSLNRSISQLHQRPSAQIPALHWVPLTQGFIQSSLGLHSTLTGTKCRRSDSGQSRLGHDRGRGCKACGYYSPVHHACVQTPRGGGQPPFLSSLFCPGLSRGMGMSFHLSGAGYSPPAWGLEWLYRIQPELLPFP